MNSFQQSEGHYDKLYECLLEVKGALIFKRDPKNWSYAERFPEKNMLVQNCMLHYDRYISEATLHLQTVCHSPDPMVQAQCSSLREKFKDTKNQVHNEMVGSFRRASGDEMRQFHYNLQQIDERNSI